LANLVFRTTSPSGVTSSIRRLSASEIRNPAAASQLVPYIKLVERERLRVSPRSEQAYLEFYRSAEADRLSRFDEENERQRQLQLEAFAARVPVVVDGLIAVLPEHLTPSDIEDLALRLLIASHLATYSQDRP